MQLWLDPSSRHDTEPCPSLLPNAPSGETCSSFHHLRHESDKGTPPTIEDESLCAWLWYVRDMLLYPSGKRSLFRHRKVDAQRARPQPVPLKLARHSTEKPLVACAGLMLSVCFTLHQTIMVMMKWRKFGWPLFAFFAVVGLSSAVIPLMWRLGLAAAKWAWWAAHWPSKALAGLMWRLMAIIARVAIALVCLLLLAVAAAVAAAFLPAEQAVLWLITSACASMAQKSASEAAAELAAAVCAAAQQPWPPSKLVRTSSAPATVHAAQALPGKASDSPCSHSAQAAASGAAELAPAQPQHTAAQSSASTRPSTGARSPHPLHTPVAPIAPSCSMMAAAPEADSAQSATQSTRATQVPGIQTEAEFAHTAQNSHTAPALASFSACQVPYSGTGATATVRLGGMVSAKPAPCPCLERAVHA